MIAILKKIIFISYILSIQSCLVIFHYLTNTTQFVKEHKVLGRWYDPQGRSLDITLLSATRNFENFRGYLYWEKPFYDSTSGRINGIFSSRQLALYIPNPYCPTCDDSEDPHSVLDNIYIAAVNDDLYTYYYQCLITQVNNQLFANLSPERVVKKASMSEDVQLNDKFSGQEIIAGNIIGRIDTKNGKMQFIPFDGDKIRELIRNGEVKIPFAEDPFMGQIMITLNTEQLRSFITKYGADERLYDHANVYTHKLSRP